jgi:dienelactone hydrolase
MPTQIDAYAKSRFTAPVAGRPETYDVYARGEGPPVVIMQEAPGIGQETLALADRLVDAGFQAWMPHWFGRLGRTSGANIIRVLCMRREFQLFAKDRPSAIVDWMRALCAHVSATTGQPRVGVIGMCLTGNFALTLIAEPSVWAAVAAQPSLPVNDPGRLHMGPGDIAAARAALDAKGPMHALRFADDPLCRAARFEGIDAAFNDDRVRVITHVMPGANHSVLTRHYDDAPGSPTRAAMDALLGYFGAPLRV